MRTNQRAQPVHSPTFTGLDETFLVMNGDVLTDMDFTALIKEHDNSDASLTIAAHNQEVKIDLGVLEANSNGELENYVEKPTLNYEVSMGVYAYSPSVLRYVPKGEYLDFPTLVHKLMAVGESVRLHRNSAFWLDIGRPDDYALAQELMEKDPRKFGMLANV